MSNDDHKSRAQAENIIDTRWVIQFKWVEEGGMRKRITRARLAARRFKDSGKDDIDQKVVVSEAARRRSKRS